MTSEATSLLLVENNAGDGVGCLLGWLELPVRQRSFEGALLAATLGPSAGLDTITPT